MAAAVLALVLADGSTAQPLTVTGMPEVTKPYSFVLQGYQVYLLGVDSVEQGQTCTIERRAWDCWAAAFSAS